MKGKHAPQGRHAKPVRCDWTLDEGSDKWDTSCDRAFCFNTDGPRENEYRYCPGCGGLIEVRT